MKNLALQKILETNSWSTHALAKLCRVSQPTVQYWLHVNLPIRRAIQLEELTGTPRHELRPDLFKNGSAVE